MIGVQFLCVTNNEMSHRETVVFSLECVYCVAGSRLRISVLTNFIAF
jgi:hypothetical protein